MNFRNAIWNCYTGGCPTVFGGFRCSGLVWALRARLRDGFKIDFAAKIIFGGSAWQFAAKNHKPRLLAECPVEATARAPLPEKSKPVTQDIAARLVGKSGVYATLRLVRCKTTDFPIQCVATYRFAVPVVFEDVAADRVGGL